MATVQKRGDTYRIKVSCGYGLDGKQIIQSMTWKPEPGQTPRQIEKELERQKVLFEERCKSGQYISSRMRFADFVDIWRKDYALPQLAPKTYTRYETLLARILPAIGHIPLSKLQPHHLLDFYNHLATECPSGKAAYRLKAEYLPVLEGKSAHAVCKRTGISETTVLSLKKGQAIRADTMQKLRDGYRLPEKAFERQQTATLSDVTIRHHHRLISAILNTAVQWGALPHNPCDRVKPPKAMQKEAVYLDDKQAVHLVELLADAPIQQRTMIITLLYTGMRLGELCGLEWKDIDSEKQMIAVRRSSQYLPGKGIFTKEPKNKSSIRTNKYAPELFALLREYRIWQTEQRLKVGDRWQDCDRLFTQWDGSPIYPASVSAWFHKWIANTDLPRITVHSLRHTNATLLISGGVDIRTVSRRLGHSQTSTTMNIYAHAIKSADEMAADVIHLPSIEKAIKKAE